VRERQTTVDFYLQFFTAFGLYVFGTLGNEANFII